MSGDHTPLDDGDARNSRKVERNLALPYASESVTRARRGLCADLRFLGIRSARIDDAALILSELVSNVLRHARPLPGNIVGVSWRIEVSGGVGGGERLEIAVRDGGSSTMPRVARPSVSGLGGRGLGIVQSLAGRWGTEMDATTTTVWAVLEVTAEEFLWASDDTVVDLPVPCPEEGDTPQGEADVVEFDLGARRDEPAWGVVL